MRVFKDKVMVKLTNDRIACIEDYNYDCIIINNAIKLFRN